MRQVKWIGGSTLFDYILIYKLKIKYKLKEIGE